ncbi:hypothetical protein KC930_03535 [Candidatus Saccharibacteria bacterium]|nr:hypothetical protein [Candidatus Saccharibacteria bacterium]
MIRGGMAVVAGNGRLYSFGGADDGAPVIEHEVVPGLYRYPNGDPRSDSVWNELHGHERIFKDEFLVADRELGFHTHHGGAAFSAIAKYLLMKSGRGEDEYSLRASLLAENYKRSRTVYAIGAQALASIITSIEYGDTEVSGLMSPNRMELIRAVLSDTAEMSTPKSIEDLILELQASGYAVEEFKIGAGGRLVYRALDQTRLLVTKGSIIARVQNFDMSLYVRGEICEIDQWETAEVVAGEFGADYIRAVLCLDGV